MITLIDNYDSFTYNLYQYLGELGMETTVYRNDEKAPEEIIKEAPKGIMISPGPSDPDHAGICLALTQQCIDHDIPLFGICLGHQTIGQALGGTVVQTKPFHGKTSTIEHYKTGIFKDLASPLKVTRYHSLIIEKCPEDLRVTAETDDGIIMGVEHKSKPVHGVQFHPESIETDHGLTMIKNFCGML